MVMRFSHSNGNRGIRESDTSMIIIFGDTFFKLLAMECNAPSMKIVKSKVDTIINH